MTGLLGVAVALAVVAWIGLAAGRRRASAPVVDPDVPAQAGRPELAWVVRANRALGLWVRGPGQEQEEVTTPALGETARSTIAARLAGLGGGSARSGVERLDEGPLAYVATDDIQAAILLPPEAPTDRALEDLGRLVAMIRTGTALRLSDADPGRVESVGSVAIRLALDLESLLDAEVAVAVQQPRGVKVLGVSLRADTQLNRQVALPGSAVDLACRGEVTRPALAYEPMGVPSSDRRHRERKAYVVPVTGPSGVHAAAVIWTPNGAEPGGPQAAELARRVERAGHLFERAFRERGLVDQAVRDPLTGLVNRRGLEAAMRDVSAESGCLICLDLDHFKSLNDELGHPAGDAALGFVARVVRDTVRDQDTAARIGGEEFAVWLPGTGLAEAAKVAERIRTRLAGRAWGWQGRPWPITGSLGVAGWPESSRNRDNLVALVDRALYRAKETGRNRVEVWGESA